MIRVIFDVPPELEGHQIELPRDAHGFGLSLDEAEPWAGGRFVGRVEARGEGHDEHPVTVAVRCYAAWLDLPPQLVGQKRFGPLTFWDMRMRAVPIWIEEEIFVEQWELGDLASVNWRHFELDLPPELPRAFEGTFTAFRWRIEARRSKRIGHEVCSLPVLIAEPRDQPVVRVETSPIGSWRLLEWKAEDEQDAHGGPCSVSFASRRPEDMPLDGETREQELARRRAES